MPRGVIFRSAADVVGPAGKEFEQRALTFGRGQLCGGALKEGIIGQAAGDCGQLGQRGWITLRQIGIGDGPGGLMGRD